MSGDAQSPPPGDDAPAAAAPRRRARPAADAGTSAAKRRTPSGGAGSPPAAWPPPPPALDAASAAELRSRSAVLLAEALQDSTPLYDHGCAVEAAVFAASGSAAGSREYTSSVRRLVASLRRNEELRRAVTSGALPPAELATAPPEALATRAQRAARDAAEEAATRRAMAGEVAEAGLPTKDHACPLCGASDAMFVRIGGARDIGKSETWGSKDAQDAHALRLTCTSCKHEWKTGQ